MNAMSAFDELDAAIRRSRYSIVVQAGCVLLTLLTSGIILGFGFSLGILLAVKV